MVEFPLIEVKNVTKKYKNNLVLDDISLDIPTGRIFGIIGKSGCGKTTLLNLLIGFLKPTKGAIYFQSKDVSKRRRRIEKNFGFAAQIPSFYPQLTIKENLDYFGTLYGLEKADIKSRTKELLRLVGLENKGEVLGRQLSAGMQRRLDIACSLIHQPKVLILDEPTQDLDPMLRNEILKLIQKINKESGVSVIITSHILGEIDRLCNIIAIIKDGKISKLNSPSELEEEYSKNKIIIIETVSADYNKILPGLKKEKNITKIEEYGGRLLISAKDPKKAFNRIFTIVNKEKEILSYAKLSKPSLELVFENIMGEA